MSHRKEIEKAAQNFARAAKSLKPAGSSFCVLMWGPDESGQQWMTYAHDTSPLSGPSNQGTRRLNLAKQLREIADVIEQGADLPPGVAGHG